MASDGDCRSSSGTDCGPANTTGWALSAGVKAPLYLQRTKSNLGSRNNCMLKELCACFIKNHTLLSIQRALTEAGLVGNNDKVLFMKSNSKIFDYYRKHVIPSTLIFVISFYCKEFY